MINLSMKSVNHLVDFLTKWLHNEKYLLYIEGLVVVFTNVTSLQLKI